MGPYYIPTLELGEGAWDCCELAQVPCPPSLWALCSSNHFECWVLVVVVLKVAIDICMLCSILVSRLVPPSLRHLFKAYPLAMCLIQVIKENLLDHGHMQHAEVTECS